MFHPLMMFIEYGERVDKLDEVLDWLRAFAPPLFEEPPSNTLEYGGITVAAGWVLLRHGDERRGEPLLRRGLQQMGQRQQAGVFIDPLNLIVYQILGETEMALETIRAIQAGSLFHRASGLDYQVIFRYSSLFESLRRQPEFVALLDEYDRNAGEQRALLKAMDLPVK